VGRRRAQEGALAVPEGGGGGRDPRAQQRGLLSGPRHRREEERRGPRARGTARAARAGDIAGCANLAICYRDEGNFRWARFWFEKAYAQGDDDAALELGRLFLWEGPNQNHRKVVDYLSKAAASQGISAEGRKEAGTLLKSVARK
jgi:hypothetical protein